MVLDQIRVSTLELAVEEIKRKNLQGNIAELGVYQASFAKRMHALLPEKKIYLFDTFEGFDQKQFEEEQRGDVNTSLRFSDTSVELVMKEMNWSENVIIKQGFFPDTTVGVNDTFCLVSLDCDLYEPMLAGLTFFYNHLEEGGFIFVHDYWHDKFRGAKKAVHDFCDQKHICFTTIPDVCGTAIIRKEYK